MKPILIAGSLIALIASAHAFTVPTPFKNQIQQADTVARIVVVEILDLNFTEPESWCFEGMAKCRIVTDYTGLYPNSDFVYIPCRYNFDEDPSPLIAGQDYIVCLETMKHGGIAHPVSYDAVHEITGGKLLDPQSKDSYLFRLNR